MKVVVYLAFLLALVLLVLIFLDSADDTQTAVCFEGGACFTVLVADTSEEHQRGLMYVESLDLEEGMLFVFTSEENYTFWMKNTLLPLDMIWINSDFVVVDVVHAVPCTDEQCVLYSPREPAQYVLEIATNATREYAVANGDVVTIT